MNNKVVVRDSRISGKGLFAKQDIKKGEIVSDTHGQLVPDEKLDYPPYLEWSEICFQVKHGYHICPDPLTQEGMKEMFFLNHSCDPNCGIKGSTSLIAMRNIKEGEELTFDYAMTDADYEGDSGSKRKECLCGSSNCRKLITGEDWQDKKLQKRYMGFFSDYVQSRIDNL